MSEKRKWNGYATEEEYREYQKQYYEKNKKDIAQKKKNDPWNNKLRHAKLRAQKAGVPFDLTRDYLDSIRVSHCPILGIELKYTENTKICDDSATIDRIVPELGYVPGNIQMLSHKANRMKSNATSEQLIMFAKWVLKEHDHSGREGANVLPTTSGPTRGF